LVIYDWISSVRRRRFPSDGNLVLSAGEHILRKRDGRVWNVNNSSAVT
jgi:hypothetical protein